MAASDNLGSQFSENPKAAEYEATAVCSRPESKWTDKYLAGTLRGHRYPNEIGDDERFYHGSDAELQPGDYVESGHPGNFASRMKHVYMTTQPEGDESYKGARGYGRHVYQVQPTGPFGHRRDARGVEYASEWPLRVVGRHDPQRGREAT